MLLGTSLDPRFKQIGFFSPRMASEAVKGLTSECTTVLMSRSTPAAASASTLLQDAVADRPGNYFYFVLQPV